MKILRIISRMNIGGPSHHVINLAGALKKYGHETLLLSGQPNPEEKNMFYLAENRNINFRIIKSLGSSLSPVEDFKSLLTIIREIKRFKPEVVHTHTSKAGILGRLAALLCGVPQIYHSYHGHVFKGYFSKFASTLIVGIERIFSRFTTKLVALTPKLTAELETILRPSSKHKLVTIPLGLDLSLNLATPRKSSGWLDSLGFLENDFVIGIVARLVPIKNHIFLINALSKVCQKNHNVHLLIVGCGELEERLRKEADLLGLNKRIHFCGVIKDMERVYSDLDLLVLCSKNEGTPVCIIEALASGCPVASTAAGGVSEVLCQGKLGRLLPSELEAFANELSKTVKDLQHGNFKELPTYEVRRQIATKYSVENLAKNIAKLYAKGTFRKGSPNVG